METKNRPDAMPTPGKMRYCPSVETQVQSARQQFEKAFEIVVRAKDHWKAFAGVVGLGVLLTAAFVFSRQVTYISEAVLLHEEESSVLQQRQTATNTRNLSSRYKEMLLAREQLSKAVTKFNLFPDEDSLGLKVETLRQQVGFRTRGGGLFAITYQDGSPEKAKEVTDFLANNLKEEDRRIRRERTSSTKEFLEEEMTRAIAELETKERAQAEFVSEHPEFAEEDTATPGATIRAMTKRPSKKPTDRLSALKRQKSRLQQMLNTPGDTVTTTKPVTRTAEHLAYESKLRTLQRDLDTAQRQLKSALSSFTEKHPNVIEARRKAIEAESTLATARANAPATSVTVTQQVDKDTIRKELKDVERQISYFKSNNKPSPKKGDNWIVELETEWATLKRQVEQAQERVERLELQSFQAEIKVSQELAEQGSQLSIIDPANLPIFPQGKGRKVIFLAGTAVSIAAGLLMVLALALIDDRILSAKDIGKIPEIPFAIDLPFLENQDDNLGDLGDE